MNNKRLTSITTAFAALMLIMYAAPHGALSQQAKPLELTFGTPYTAEMPVQQPNIEWMQKIEKETQGRVHFKPFWAGTVISAAEGHEELAQGAADVGEIGVIMARSGYQLAKGTFLFFYASPSQETARRVSEQVRAKFPQIEQEYKGLKVMAWTSNAPTQLITRKPVRKLSDLKGMRIRTLGDYSKVFAAFGAEPVQMPASEVYVALQKGIIDGLMQPFIAFDSFHLAEVAKFATVLNIQQSFTAQRAMNLGSYNKLPPDIKKIFDLSVDWWGKEADRVVGKIADDGMQMGKKAGVEFITLSKEDMQKLNDQIKTEAVKVAKDLDAKGLPGTQIFNETRRLIEVSGK